MLNFCPYCGKPVVHEWKYCESCGKLLAEPAEVSLQPVILPKQPVLPQKQPPTPMPPVYQQTPARGSRKKLTGICVLLAGILTAEAAVLGFWKPGWFRKKDPADSVSTLVTLREETGTITADSPAVTLCGVTLNADCLNLGSEALSATVADHGETADKNGAPLHQYSISLGDRHQYDDPVALTFPSEHPEQDIVLHYDDMLEMWMPMITAADPEAKTLTACTSSFSDFAVGTIDNGFIRIADPGTPNAHPELCTGLYQKLMEVSNPVLEQTMEQFKPDPKNYRLDMPDFPPDITEDAIRDAYGDANNLWSLLAPLASVQTSLLPLEKTPMDVVMFDGRFRPYTADFKVQCADAMTDISILTMGVQICMDAQKYGIHGKTTALNAYNSFFTNTGTFYSMWTGYSSAALTLGFLGVTVISMDLYYMREDAITAQVEIDKDIMDSYYKNVHPFDEQYWYNLYTEEFWNQNMDVNAAMERVRNALNDYTEEFWKLAENPTHPDFIQAVAESRYRNFHEIDSEQKDQMTAELKYAVKMKFVERVLPKIERFLIERMQEQIRKKCYSMIEPFNRTLNFVIYENVDLTTKEKTQYRDCWLTFGKKNGPYIKNSDWLLVTPDDNAAEDGWRLTFSCRDYAWMCADLPDTLYVFRNRSDLEKGKKPLLKYSFDLHTGIDNNRTTVINLSESETYAWSLSRIEIYNNPDKMPDDTSALVSAQADAEAAYVTWKMKDENGITQEYTDSVFSPGQGLSFPDNFIFKTYYHSESPVQQMNMDSDHGAFAQESTTLNGNYGHIHNGTNVIDMPDEGMTVTVIVSHACYRIAYTYDAYPYEEAINRVPEVIVRAGSAVWELQAMVYAKEKRIESIGSDELNTSMFRGTQKIIADPNSYTYMFDYDSESFEDENYTLSLPGALATAEQMNAVFKSTDTLIVIAEIYENVPENIDYSDWQCLRKSGGLSYGALYLMQGGDAEIPDATDTGNRIMQVTVDSMNLYYRERSAADASENAWQYYEPS